MGIKGVKPTLLITQQKKNKAGIKITSIHKEKDENIRQEQQDDDRLEKQHIVNRMTKMEKESVFHDIQHRIQIFDFWETQFRVCSMNYIFQ